MSFPQPSRAKKDVRASGSYYISVRDGVDIGVEMAYKQGTAVRFQGKQTVGEIQFAGRRVSSPPTGHFWGPVIVHFLSASISK